MQREIATIGFSPYNRVLELIESNVTLYECEKKLVEGFRYRLKHYYELPDLIIVSAGIDHPGYISILDFLAEMKLDIPVMIHDQSFHRSRKRQAYRSGVSDYISEPVTDDIFEMRIGNLLERKTKLFQPVKIDRERP